MLRALAASLYLALAVALLTSCGLTDSAKSNLLEHPRFKGFAAALSGLCECGN